MTQERRGEARGGLMWVLLFIAACSGSPNRVSESAPVEEPEDSGESTMEAAVDPDVRQAEEDLARLTAGLMTFQVETGLFPGYAVPPTKNAFPEVYRKLCGDPPQAGPSAPYLSLNPERVAVFDSGSYRRANPIELDDAAVDKFYLDPWDRPYMYRENFAKRRKRESMHNLNGFDLWSFGPNGEDEGGLGDDVANW